MLKLKPAIAVIFFLALQSQALSQKRDDTGGVMLTGRYYSFILTGPSGWVLDDKAASSQGLQLTVYKAGSSWKSGVAVMYVRVIYKSEAQATLDKVIKDDIDDFMKQSRDSTVSESKALPTRDKRQAIVRNFYDAENKNYESVAFIDAPKVVVVVALSSRDKDEFDKSLPAFAALVGSYFSLIRSTSQSEKK